jgi:hypothetical protein
VTVYKGQFIRNCRRSPISLVAFSHAKMYECIILDKKDGLGYILGDFSGHPAGKSTATIVEWT